jgi:hypothetical protein
VPESPDDAAQKGQTLPVLPSLPTAFSCKLQADFPGGPQIRNGHSGFILCCFFHIFIPSEKNTRISVEA